MAHYEEWRNQKENANQKTVQFDEAPVCEPKKTVEELFADRSAQFKSQFVMDKTCASDRK